MTNGLYGGAASSQKPTGRAQRSYRFLAHRITIAKTHIDYTHFAFRHHRHCHTYFITHSRWPRAAANEKKEETSKQRAVAI